MGPTGCPDSSVRDKHCIISQKSADLNWKVVKEVSALCTKPDDNHARLRSI